MQGRLSSPSAGGKAVPILPLCDQILIPGHAVRRVFLNQFIISLLQGWGKVAKLRRKNPCRIR